MKNIPTVLIDPKSGYKWLKKHATRLPLSALRAGTTLRVPVCAGEKGDENRAERSCRILSVNRAKQLILVEYDLGGYPLKETFRYAIEEE